MLIKKPGALTLAGMSGLILTLGYSLASADVTITMSVRTVQPSDTTQTQPADTPPGETQTYTAYYKNDRARVEKGDGTVTLYDFKTSQVYRLTPADKTYTLLSLNDFLQHEPLPGMQDTSTGGAKPKTDVKLTFNKDEVVEPKSYVGRQANVYDLAGTVTVGSNAPSQSRYGGMGRRGGRRGGFPGFPSGGGGDDSGSGGGGRRASQQARTAQVEGEVWLASPDTLSDKDKISWLPLIRPGVPSGALAKPLVDKITGTKAIPVASKVSITTHNPQSGTSDTTTIYTEVKSIAEGTLDDGLFKIPSDFQRTDTH